MSLIVKLLVTALAVWLAVQLVDGLDYSGSWVGLLVIALILAVINAFARPLVTVLSLPIVLLTLGFFLLVINALMFGLTIWISGQLDLGLSSTGFWATFFGALIVTIVSWIAEAVLDND